MDYVMSENEKRMAEKLRQECIDICNKLSIPRSKRYDGSPYMGRLKDSMGFRLGYSMDIGYYAIDIDRDHEQMRPGFPTQNYNTAKFMLLAREFALGGTNYEAYKREELMRQWQNRYNCRYDPRIPAFEYAIEQNLKICSPMVDAEISRCTSYLAKNSDVRWSFNKESLHFVATY